MLNLSAEDIENKLSPSEIIAAVKAGIIKYESGLNWWQLCRLIHNEICQLF